MENLQRHTVSGLRHICDLLGAPESEDDAHVAEMVSWVNVGMDSLRAGDRSGETRTSSLIGAVGIPFSNSVSHSTCLL